MRASRVEGLTLAPVCAPTAELTAPAVRPPPAKRHRRPRRLRLGGQLYLGLGLAALLIAACSLLIPSTPSYDPWAWLVWGREIVHLNLQTTGGPSWKPLPMVFTTAFALFGHAAPDLWLVVARAGAVVAVAMTFRIAWRLTAELVAGSARASGRLGALVPLLAGLIAAGTLVNAPGFITDNALGYSEGLATALALIAVDRYLDGAPRQAFVAGFFAALDRPELWGFWIPYGLFLMWRDRGTRKLVLILFALIPVLWFGPELWGSGQLLRNVTRALHPRSNSAAFARCPVCTVFRHEAWPQVPDRIKLAGLFGVLAAAAGLWRTRAAWWRATAVSSAARARAWLVAIWLFGYLWWVGIAIETQAGFSGNNRYLVLGTAPVVIAGAIGCGWFIQLVATALRRLARRALALAVAPAAALVAGAAIAIALLLGIPPWIGKSFVDVPRLHGALVYQAHLREDMAAAVRHFGRRQILACGTVMTEGFQVPMLAYMLDVHTLRVQEPPAVAGTGPPPNVIFQTRAQRNSTLLPIIRPWHVPYTLVDDQRTVRVFMNCAAKAAI
jgi:hypothetical protein